VHELAHVLLHGPDNPDASGHRGIGEVEADSVALMVAAAHSMDTSDYTIPYVSGWAATVPEKSPVEVVQATGERVRKTSATILDQLPTEQISNGDPPGLNRSTPSTKPVAPERAAGADPLAEEPRRVAAAPVRSL
jgi:hypothetical protein